MGCAWTSVEGTGTVGVGGSAIEAVGVGVRYPESSGACCFSCCDSCANELVAGVGTGMGC